jgi:hypothetical protein
VFDRDKGDALDMSKLAGWAGIVFSLLSLAVLPLAVPPPPPLGALPSELGAWFAAHHTGFLVGNYLGILAFFPGFVQLVVFVAEVRRREGEGFLAPLVLATGTFAYAVFACSLMVFQALPFLISDASFGVLGTLANVWFALDGLAALPLVLAVAWASRKTRALPAWFGPLSAVVAVVALVMSLGALTATPVWLAGGGLMTGFGFIAFFVWTGIWAVLMLRSGVS